ncbi:MAG: hypothetical protein ABSA44_08480 [Bacteroidota bacterium]
MFEKQNVQDNPIYGRYIGDFSSDPNRQIHSTVFHDGQIVHIFHKIKNGFSFVTGTEISITDNWLNEIFVFLDRENISRENVHLYDKGTF